MHSVIMILMQPKERLQPHGEYGIFQVTLQPDTKSDQHSSSLKASLPAVRKTEVEQKPPSLPSVKLPALFNFPIGNGLQMSSRLPGQPSPALQQNQIMKSMQQAQLAQQRAMLTASVRAALSNLSGQISPAITGKISCVQQANNEIECVPAQKEKVDALLKQFFSLALEAHRLGIAENPLRMDFGPEKGVSILLLSEQN